MSKLFTDLKFPFKFSKENEIYINIYSNKLPQNNYLTSKAFTKSFLIQQPQHTFCCNFVTNKQLMYKNIWFCISKAPCQIYCYLLLMKQAHNLNFSSIMKLILGYYRFSKRKRTSQHVQTTELRLACA